jgi:hypothetical protein
MSTSIPAEMRRFVIARADSRCEYCRMPSDDVILPHEPDHIIAVKHGGATIEDNLAVACFLCNRFKGTDLASLDPDTGLLTRLFHPRSDAWNEHFQIHDNGIIRPRTNVGRTTARLLRFNLPESVATRRLLISCGVGFP